MNDQVPQKAPSTLSVCPLLGRAGIRVVGEINYLTRDVWESALADVVSRAAGRDDRVVHLELSELDCVDAGGAAALMKVVRASEDRRVILHDPPAQLCRILDVLWPKASGVEVAE